MTIPTTTESGDLMAVARNIVNVVLEEFTDSLRSMVIFQGGEHTVVRARQVINDRLDEWVLTMLRSTIAQASGRPSPPSTLGDQPINEGATVSDPHEQTSETPPDDAPEEDPSAGAGIDSPPVPTSVDKCTECGIGHESDVDCDPTDLAMHAEAQRVAGQGEG